MKMRAGLSPSLALLLLSALWAVGWLLPDLFPHFGAEGISLAAGQAILLSVFAVLAASVAVVQGLKFPRGRRAWTSVGVGMGLFVIPTGAAAYARGWISNFDAVAIFCLTPVFAVVLEPYLQNCPPRRGKGALAGCWVAIAGILCFFPLEMPSSFRAGAALGALFVAALAVAAANCIAVRTASYEGGGWSLPMAAQAAGTGALCFAVMAVILAKTTGTASAPANFIPKLFLVDVPGLFLLFWLMARVAASRMTARFLLAPLFASVAGLALERMLPPVRGMLGLLLLAGGSGWLVFAPAETEEGERISLRTVPVAPADRPTQGN
ncbi:MAG TPA: hypothetical protein VHX13_09445 [Acidobacteriaceae bacterium]|jgi:drug/metabolite transporter (DMT)-like permease|nr:hypothetical protein [Acidobacteriaceae bacterium]